MVHCKVGRIIQPLFIALVMNFVLIGYVFAGIENRPLNTDEATVLDKGKFVIATGATFLRQHNSDKEFDWVTDFEYGILNNLEFDVEVPYKVLYFKDNNDQKDINGLGDVATWLEFAYLKEKEILPGASVAFSVKTHTGNNRKNLGTGKNNYQFVLLFTKNINKLCTSVNFGYTIVGKPADLAWKNTLSYNLALEYTLNDKFLLVWEIYGQTNQDKEANRDPLDTLAGMVYTFNDHLAVDFGIGAGLTTASPDLRVTSGVTYSF